MMKRGTSTGVAVRGVLVVSTLIVASVALVGASGAAGSHRPDAWIKLCGPKNTCLNAAWHPWLGDNVYDTNGHGQKVSAGVEEGNMIRFWVLLQNDGAAGDTLRVKGCSGNGAYSLAVNTGAWRYYTSKAKITSAFKAGTAKFTFPPASTGKSVIITLAFRANTSSRGARYTCPITVSSAAQPGIKDTVVADMTTI
jgi:hypothetical protein